MLNELDISHSRLISAGMARMNKLKRKRLLGHAREWYVLIDISQTYSNIQVLDYTVVSFLVFFFLIFLFYDTLCNGIIPLLYSLLFFHLSLSRVDQIANLLNTYPINTFLKSLWVAVKLEVIV